MTDRADAALRERALAMAAHFAPDRTPARAAALGNGHIHATFLVELDGGGPGLVLQRLDEDVFPDVDALMANVVRVTSRLRAASSATGRELARRVLCNVPSTAGGWLVRDDDGRAWRATVQVARARSVDLAESPEQAWQAARCFGAFAFALADLDPAALVEVIPRFHDTSLRVEALSEAVAGDEFRRRAGAEREIESIAKHWQRLCDALPSQDEPGTRVVHNDCKLNNVLFDLETGEALLAVDLDTTWAGRLANDFGELVRSAGCPAAEDEPDLARIQVDEELLGALADGYVAGVAPSLTRAELESLPVAGPLMAFENAARFLTDHLRGDSYFGVERRAQNLDRTRAQLARVERLMEARGLLEEALERAWRRVPRER